MFTNGDDDEGNGSRVGDCNVMKMVRGELRIWSFDEMGDSCGWVRGWDVGTRAKKGYGERIVKMH